MASNTTKKSKSSGMRMLWIPGRKSHSKGRFSTTSKHISYSGPQKKSEVWSLGGSKAQSELIDLPSPDLAVAGAPSSLSLVATCSLAAQSGKSDCASSDGSAIVSETATLPATPVTTPNLRGTGTYSLSEIEPSTPSTRAMTSPNVITTAEILDFPHFVAPEDLPKVPAAAGEPAEVGLNSSAGTTASIATTSSPLAGAQDTAHSHQTTPQKNKYKNNNNNQEDINSIESFQGNPTDFDWIDEMVQQRNCNEMMHKNKRKKASRKGLDGISQPEADQLDGQALYSYNNNAKAKSSSSKANDGDNDEKVVKCLYYSLMCCDCTIS